ncbi:hypothetical protein ACAW63_20690 [Pseudomonas sp. QE6]|uniref:hypothetical protein n=1 Tax=Pseudomonas sp. QE6 TaxID=3242491 RepID=UPI003529A524
MQSWLHLLAKAGLLSRPDAPTITPIESQEPDENPSISGLGFELCTDMVLDFAQVARLSSLKDEEAQAAPPSDEPDASGQDQILSSSASGADVPAMAFAEQQTVETPNVAAQGEALERDQQAESPKTEPVWADQSPDPVSGADESSLFACLEAMMSSLEAAGHTAAIGAAAAAASDEPAAHAVDAPEARNSKLEAALQGILIHKECVMTEMHDVMPEADMPGASVPIASAELQEVEAALSVPQLDADPDDVLSDVQSTLNSLAGMAQGLSQQKQAAGRLQEELDERSNQLQERERLANDKEERLLQLENHLKEAKANLDRMAAENNRLLAERSEALKELAQTVDLRDKATLKRAEAIQLEQQRIDEQSASLRARASELDERESALKRKSEELGMRLRQLQSAKDKFSAIVKSFNETVQFNSTLSAISKSVVE